MKIIGHRGARGLAPENTIAALKKGLQYNVDGLEFDLRVTKDKVVVLHHDPEITVKDGTKFMISEHKLEELLRYKNDLATFDEVMEEIGHPVLLYAEIKPNEPIKPIVNAIKARLKNGWKPEYFRISSFSLKILKEVHREIPEITLTVLEKWSGVRATHRARLLGTKHIIMNERWLWGGFIKQMSRGGYKLGAYTLNDPIKAERWQKYGLRALVTDRPDLFSK